MLQVTWCSRKTRDEAGPDERDQRALQVAVDQPAGREGDRQPEQHPQLEVPADEAHSRILDQVARVLAPRGAALLGHQPADMGMHQAAQAVPVAEVRAVRIAFLVGVGVMLAVVGDPVDDRPLN